MDNPVIVDFPLRGEWVAVHTPAKRIPSHGTDMLGQRYAYDFIRTDNRKGLHYCPVSHFRLLVFGIPVSRCYGWGENVCAPFDGKVAKMKDGLKERQRLFPLLDLLIVIKNMLTFSRNDKALHRVMGNYIMLEKDDIYAAFAHLLPGSIEVRQGQEVKAGQRIAKVGHTGNSTAPHLHFQLMDRADILTAKGVPCAFKEYEVLKDGTWQNTIGSIPEYGERIRYMK